MMSLPIALNVSADHPKITVGLSWEPVSDNGRSSVISDPVAQDADLSCFLFDGAGALIDSITPVAPQREKYRQKVFHTGDHTDGGSEFEDEEIQVWLSHLDETIAGIAFGVSTKGAILLQDLNRPKFVVMDATSLEVFYSQNLSDVEGTPAEDAAQWQYIAGAALRDKQNSDKWNFVPVGSYLADIQNISNLMQEHCS